MLYQKLILALGAQLCVNKSDTSICNVAKSKVKAMLETQLITGERKQVVICKLFVNPKSFYLIVIVFNCSLYTSTMIYVSDYFLVNSSALFMYIVTMYLKRTIELRNSLYISLFPLHCFRCFTKPTTQ